MSHWDEIFKDHKPAKEAPIVSPSNEEMNLAKLREFERMHRGEVFEAPSPGFKERYLQSNREHLALLQERVRILQSKNKSKKLNEIIQRNKVIEVLQRLIAQSESSK